MDRCVGTWRGFEENIRYEANSTSVSPDQARDDWPDYAEIRRRRAERRALYVAGMPDIVHLSLPMETPVVRSREVAQIPLSEYEAELRTDASYSYGDQVVGAAWQLVIGGIEALVIVC